MTKRRTVRQEFARARHFAAAWGAEVREVREVDGALRVRLTIRPAPGRSLSTSGRDLVECVTLAKGHLVRQAFGGTVGR